MFHEETKEVVAVPEPRVVQLPILSNTFGGFSLVWTFLEGVMGRADR